MSFFNFRVASGEGDRWWVCLPHQCDGWEIAGDEFYGVPHDEAVDSLEQFIEEAGDALAALRERREIDPWQGGAAS